MTVRPTLSGAVVAALLATVVPVASAQTPVAHDRTHDRWAGAVSRLHRDTTYPAHGGTVVDALHYGLKLRWAPATKTLTGHETLTFRAARSATRFSVELLNSLAVSSARVNGTSTIPTHSNDHLTFHVPVQRGSRYVLRLTYAGVPHPVPAPTHRSDFSTLGFTPMPDGSAWTMQEPFGAYTWYAVNDTPADKAYYDFTVAAPSGMVGVANGALRSRTQVGSSDGHALAPRRTVRVVPDDAGHRRLRAPRPARREGAADRAVDPSREPEGAQDPRLCLEGGALPAAPGGPLPVLHARDRGRADGVGDGDPDDGHDGEPARRAEPRQRRPRDRAPVVRRHRHAARLERPLDERGHGALPRRDPLVGTLPPHLDELAPRELRQHRAGGAS